MVKYPEVTVRLVGEDGNAYSIIARVSEALKRHGVKRDVIQEFVKEATKGSYDELLVTVLNWVETDDDEDEYDGKTCGWCEELHEDCEC